MAGTFIIAEIGQAHDGSLGILHSYIDALANTGINAVKFQTHIAEAESSSEEPFRVNFSYEDKTRYDYWERMSFTLDQWLEIKQHCENVGLEFISSPFSLAAVDLLESLEVKQYKIGSGEVNNFLLLEKVCKTGKPILLSSGMSSFCELEDSVNFIREYGNPLTLLQCTTSYPTTPENLGLNVISEMKDRFGLPVGFSDHSGKLAPSIAAVAMGAEVLEFHVVFDQRMFGPDSQSSLTIDKVAHLADEVRLIDVAKQNPLDKNDNSAFSDVKKIFEKSLAVNKNLEANHVITFDDLESKKPAQRGISAKDYSSVLGKKLTRAKEKYTFLSWEDLEDENEK